jgi:hypothetical protein
MLPRHVRYKCGIVQQHFLYHTTPTSLVDMLIWAPHRIMVRKQSTHCSRKWSEAIIIRWNCNIWISVLPTCAFASLNRSNLPSLPSVDTTDKIRTLEYSFVAIRRNCQVFIPWDLSVKGHIQFQVEPYPNQILLLQTTIDSTSTQGCIPSCPLPSSQTAG